VNQFFQPRHLLFRQGNSVSPILIISGGEIGEQLIFSNFIKIGDKQNIHTKIEEIEPKDCSFSYQVLGKKFMGWHSILLTSILNTLS
jgi:hypothetical protein